MPATSYKENKPRYLTLAEGVLNKKKNKRKQTTPLSAFVSFLIILKSEDLFDCESYHFPPFFPPGFSQEPNTSVFWFLNIRKQNYKKGLKAHMWIRNNLLSKIHLLSFSKETYLSDLYTEPLQSRSE